MIYVKDLLKLKSFKEFKLVSGESGLNRSVSWPNIAQTTSISEWLVGGDVILMTGVGLEISEEFLTNIVIEAAQGQAACIIMLLHPKHIKSIPDSVVKVASDRHLALFTAPWETKLFEVIGSISMVVANDRLEERMHNEFLERLLAGEINIEDPLYIKYFEKYNLLDRKVVVTIKYDFKGKNSKSGKSVYYSERIMTEMIQNFMRYFEEINYLNKYNRQTFIISVSDMNEKNIVDTIKTIYYTFNKQFADIQMQMGIGKVTHKVKNGNDASGENMKEVLEHQSQELMKSYQQAKTTVKAIQKKGVFYYKELGIYQLLFYIDDKERINEFVENYISPVMEYDRRYNQNLLDTLREYLENGLNVTQTAQALYIHRNTMIKRIEKIEELLECSLKDADTCNQIFNAVKIYDLFLNNN